LIWLAAIALAVATPAPPPAPSVPPITSAFATDSLWDDGRAEHIDYFTFAASSSGTPAHYPSSIVVRKMIVPGPALSIGGGPAVRKPEALEMTYVMDLPTGADTCHRSVTILFDRRSFRVSGATATVTEAGETHSLKAVPRGANLRYTAGADSLDLPWGPDVVFYDALPVWLRGLDLQTPARFPVRLVPELWPGRAGKPALVPAEIEVIGPAGRPSETSHGGIEADVRHEGKVDRFWFHPGPARFLMVWDRADGTELTLRSNRRE
jgi:hypothetical protein